MFNAEQLLPDCRRAGAEREADATAAQAALGESLRRGSLSPMPVSIQRALTTPMDDSRATAVLGLLVDDEAEPAPHQRRKADFLTALERATNATARAELAGTSFSAEDCPSIVQWFAYYRGRSAVEIERAALRYAAESAGAESTVALIEVLTARIARGIARWRATGATPADDMPTAAEDAEATVPNVGQMKRRDGMPGRASNLALHSAGRTLDSVTRARMETAFGEHFGDVRVHDDGSAHQLSHALDARAFTVGSNIAFARGEYVPGTLSGELLLAHELAHVVQQRGGGPLSAEASAEHDADRAATSALLGAGERPQRLGGLALQRCNRRSAPTPVATVGDPTRSPTFEHWLTTFPNYSGSGDLDITSATPADLRNLITGGAGLTPDCADVSLLLRHYWLKANRQTFTFKAGPSQGSDFTIGFGVSDTEVGACMRNLGTINFQEDRRGFRMVQWYKAGGTMIRNLRALLAAGLKPGDLLVWKRLPHLTGNFEGHVQTVQAIDAAGRTITVVQGNMSQGVGVGMLQQRQKTFADLTGVPDGNANILDAAEEFFFGAGPWAT
jgi:hypothetical protein